MSRRRSGSYTQMSEMFKDFAAEVSGRLDSSLVRKITRLQNQELHWLGEEVKAGVAAGGLGRMPRHFNMSSRIASAVHYEVDPSEAKKRFPGSRLTVGYDEVPSTSSVDQQPDFTVFQESTAGNRPFSKRKNRGAGGEGYDIIQAVEYGRSPFLRRNGSVYTDVFGNKTHKGFHPLDATFQYKLPEMRNRYLRAQSLLVAEHFRDLGSR